MGLHKVNPSIMIVLSPSGVVLRFSGSLHVNCDNCEGGKRMMLMIESQMSHNVRYSIKITEDPYFALDREHLLPKRQSYSPVFQVETRTQANSDIFMYKPNEISTNFMIG